MDQPRTIHLSATAVKAFKGCPVSFCLPYVEGLRPIEDTDSQRMGTNWHALHEVYRNQVITNEHPDNPGLHDSPFDAAITHLNEAYATCPDGKAVEDWAVERTILATSFAAYVWYYQNDPLEVVATEIAFELPVHHPKTGLPLSMQDVIRIGKIDTLVRREAVVAPWDYKSTSKDIGPTSGFWDHLRLDTQISMYVMAAQELHLVDGLCQYGILPQERVAGAGYDVWRKPGLRPSKLTQAESKALVETGKYLEEEFTVSMEGSLSTLHAVVNGKAAETELGKKEGTFSIRETPEMFGVRLMKDIMLRPDYYFQRRVIPRTDADIRTFRAELYNIYQSMKTMRDSGHWFHNEHQCRATYPCPYIPACHHGLDVSEGKTPSGFKRIFTPVTVGGEEL